MPANVETMFSGGGQIPWHRLGEVIEGAATAEEALQKGGLDWIVKKVPLYMPKMVRDEAGNLTEQHIMLPNRYATVRSTDDAVLGVVQEKYHPLQNVKAFEFFDSIVSSKEAIYETAGVLDEGRRVWILAKLPGEIVVRVNGRESDLTNKYVLLANSHDGSSGVQIKITPIRVVCQNTLSAALKGGGAFNIRHTKSVEDRVKKAAEVMGFTNKMYTELGEAFQAMASKTMKDADVLSYFERCLAKAEKDTAKMSDNDALADDAPEQTGESREPRALKQLWRLYETGAGSDLSVGTAWGAYNAVTEYVDWKPNYRGDDQRLNSIGFDGSGVKLKQRAYAEAVALLKK